LLLGLAEPLPPPPAFQGVQLYEGNGLSTQPFYLEDTMLRNVTLALVVLLLSSPFLMAAAPPQQGGGFRTTGGDSPLTTAFTWQGHGDAVVAPLAFDGLPSVSGTFAVSGIPSGSTVIKAYYALTGWQSGVVSASGTFAGNNLGSLAPTVYDQGSSYYLCLYRWDVTPYVTGNGSYSFSGSSLNYCYLAYLVVVYEHPSCPEVTIAINDGAESLQNASSTSLFSGFGPGVGTIKIVTQAGDDTGAAEMIEFNGEILAGPGNIFNSNLGPHADYHEFDLTNIETDNSLTITVDEDWIGIHLAVLVGGPGPDATMSCETFTPVFCRGKKFYFKLTVNNNTEDDISGTLTFSGYAGHDCDPANLLVGIPRYKTYVPGTTEQYYMFKVPSAAGPGLYSASVSGTLAGVDLLCCMNTEIIQCEPWRAGGDMEWNLEQVDRPDVALPATTALHQNYPNPFNAETNVSFSLAEAGNVSLEVYDITGRLVTTLIEGEIEGGEHLISWDASEVSSGVYFYKLTAGDYSEAKRMMLVK
jgi:hypothetical protein